MKNYFILSENENISGGEISMDQSLRLEISHSVGYLCREIAQRDDRELRYERRFFETLE